MGKDKSLPKSRTPERWLTQVGYGLAHYKHSSSLRKFVNYRSKKFYNTGPMGLYCKYFLRPYFTDFRNKLEFLYLASFYSLV